MRSSRRGYTSSAAHPGHGPANSFGIKMRNNVGRALIIAWLIVLAVGLIISPMMTLAVLGYVTFVSLLVVTLFYIIERTTRPRG